MIAVDVSPKLVSALIGAIYDCALDPSRWENALGRMVAALDCHNALLSLTDMRYDRLLLTRSFGMNEEWWRAFQDKHVPEVAAQLSAILATWPSDKPFVMSRDLSPDIVQNSAYIEDAFRPEGIVDVLQCFLIGSPKRFAGLALGRRQPRGDFWIVTSSWPNCCFPISAAPSLFPIFWMYRRWSAPISSQRSMRCDVLCFSPMSTAKSFTPTGRPKTCCAMRQQFETSAGFSRPLGTGLDRAQPGHKAGGEGRFPDWENRPGCETVRRRFNSGAGAYSAADDRRIAKPLRAGGGGRGIYPQPRRRA